MRIGKPCHLAFLLVSVLACEEPSRPAPLPPRAPLPPPQYPYGPPPPYYPPQYSPPPPAPAPTPAAAPAPAPAVARPLLGPLVGAPAWQSEARAVVQELIGSLDAQKQSLVATIPLVFDPNAGEVNAFAGCDDDGAPFVAGTEGLLEAIDGIAQTKATDETFGTQAYESYVSAVAPRLVSQGGSAMLPAGVIAPAQFFDVRRISRAHEIYDEIVAFTFGHELAHHYLGHTGCAHGSPSPGPPTGKSPPDPQTVWRIASSAVPMLNQLNEGAADSSGCENVLAAGRARSAGATYRWNEEGGLWLLDFFARLDRAAGQSPLLGFLRTHPNPAVRVPIVQTTAVSWRWQHPG